MFTRALLSLFFYLSAPVTPHSSLPSEKIGWIGGDRAYTIRLDSDTRLWLLGDSWLGSLVDGKRSDAVIVNNTIAIETRLSKSQNFEYFWGDHNSSFFVNPRQGEWYWPQDGAVSDGRLYLILQRLRKTGASSPFDFESVGADLASIEFREKSPKNWKISIRPIAASPVDLGTAVALSADRYLYTYASDKHEQHHIYLARVGLEELAAAEGEVKFQYFGGDGTWRYQASDLRPLFDGAPEMSVRWDSNQKRWKATYSLGGLSRFIVTRTSSLLEGPWGEPKPVYQCPEMAWSERYYCYEGKQIDPMDSDEPFSVTYLVNSFHFWDVAKDARIYRPQIITP